MTVFDRIRQRRQKVKALNKQLKADGFLEIYPIVNGEDFRLDLGRELQIYLIECIIDYQDQSNKHFAPLVQVMGKDGNEFDFRLEQTTYIVQCEQIYDEIIAEYYCNY